MAIRTILVGASGGTASNGAVDLACRLAVRFGAFVEGYHVKFDPNELAAATAGAGLGMPVDGGWIEDRIGSADDLAATTRRAFFEAAARHGLPSADAPSRPSPCAAWREKVGRVTAIVASRARFFDLVVLGRSDRVIDQPSSDAIEETLLHSGRPVLLAPAAPPTAIGETIAIGWDGSPRSVRAVAASLPLLRKAAKTVILTVGGRPDADVAALTDYLAWHRVASETRRERVIEGLRAGEQLLAAARDAGADLLVMGAYAHAPWRETLFGGATHTIVGTSQLPILLAH